MFIILALGLAAGPDLAGASAPGLAAISEDAIRADVRFLSDDLLEGRRSGEPGHAIAARYIAARMEALGLRPAGTEGFLQPVRLREVRVDLAASSITVLPADGGASERLRLPDEAFLVGDPTRDNVEAEGPLTFAGYGTCGTERAAAGGGDRSAGRDLEGRIAVVLGGGPDVATVGPKWPCLASRGAIAMVTLRTPTQEAAVPWSVVLASASGLVLGLADPAPDAIPVAAVLDRPVAERLLARAGRRLEEALRRARSGPVTEPLPLRIRLHRAGEGRERVADNVLGRLEGADSMLSREVVVVSAHLDHHGVCREDGPDRICNGAIDNASGIAQLLAVAGALVAQPRRPARSVLFLATTAEEIGLLGAEHFVRHPTVPRDLMVADLNIDQTGMLWPVHDVVADGAQHSSLDTHARAAAEVLGLSVSPDPVPEQGFFARSDQVVFARAGVPALIARPGFRDGEGGTERNAGLFRRWRASTYHSPADQFEQDPPIDFGSGVTMARFYFLVALSVADAPGCPTWNHDAPFRGPAPPASPPGRPPQSQRD